MSNNISIKDGAGVDVVVKTTDNAGVHTPHHNVDSSALPTGAATETSLSAVKTSVELLDDAILAVDAAIGSAKVVMIGAIRDDALTTLTPVENDAVPLRVDSTGALHVTGAGGGTQFAVDSALGATPTGTLAIAKRDDVLSALTPIEGDAVELRVDSEGALWVSAKPGAAQKTDDAAFTPASDAVIVIGFQADETSPDSVDEGDAGAARMTLDRKQIVTTRGHPTGGATLFKNIDVDETEDQISATAATLYSLYLINTTAAIIFVKLYNATAANVTVGTTVPDVTIPVPGNNDTDGAGVVLTYPMGMAFSTALTIAATTGVADNDAGAPGANAIVASGTYVA